MDYYKLIFSLRIGKNNKFKPKVYFEEWDDPYISAIGWVSEIIEIAGGVDIFAERSKAHKSKVRSVSSNEVICKNPDIIFASWCGKKVNFKKIKERDGWDLISAIKNVLFSKRREELVGLGLQRVGIFSWKKCAEETISVYERL